MLYHKGKRRVEMYSIQKALITLMLLVFTAAFAAGSMADYHNNSKAAPMKFVGAYYSLAGDLTTFHSDGTMSAVTSVMFSDDPINNSFQGRKVTPSRGAWRVVGPNTIRVTGIRFLTEAFGHNYQPDGVIVKSTWEAVFDKPVRGKSPAYHVDTITSEIFLPGQNPITDEPVLVLEFPGSEGAIRIKAE
jgi:hypothetical protein